MIHFQRFLELRYDIDCEIDSSQSYILMRICVDSDISFDYMRVHLDATDDVLLTRLTYASESTKRAIIAYVCETRRRLYDAIYLPRE